MNVSMNEYCVNKSNWDLRADSSSPCNRASLPENVSTAISCLVKETKEFAEIILEEEATVMTFLRSRFLIVDSNSTEICASFIGSWMNCWLDGSMTVNDWMCS